MAGIINNPEAINTFRHQLLELVDSLREQMRKTDASIDEVSLGWQDAKFKEFSNKFNEDKEVIEPLCKDIEAFEENLHQLENILEDYGNVSI